MTKRSLVLLLVGILVATAASAAKVLVQTDPDANFSSLSTYAWRQDEPPIDAAIDREIRVSCDRVLAKKGLKRVEKDQAPDLYIEYAAGAIDVLQAGVRLVPGWWGGLWAVGGAVSQIEAGIIFVFTDVAADKPIWAGSLKLRGTTPGADIILRERAHKEAAKVIKKYPALDR